MGDIYLTVAELAELKACSTKYIQRILLEGKLQAETIEVKGRGHASLEYRIPLTALEQKLQMKYKRKQLQAQREARALEESTSIWQPAVDPLNFETITAAEREQIAFWTSILSEWRTFRVTSSLPKAEADMQFEAFIKARLASTHPDVSISLKTLYRKQKALKDKGEAGLIDKRGKHKNRHKKVSDEMQEIFEFYYLDETKKTTRLCRHLTELELKSRYGEIEPLPSIRTFERLPERIPEPVRILFREGEKAYIGKCAPYISRMYDDLEPNDIWVADGHTFDIMVRGKDGKPFRPSFSAFMDVRTRKMMGWLVTNTFSGDVTIYALKRGIEKYGVPKAILVDNGREYLFQDFSGNAGFRKKAKPKAGEFKPPTILETLGIEIRVAIPKNARGKSIERAFKTVKETFSKLFASYTGGSVDEKPEGLKDVLKDIEGLISIDEFTSYVDTYIDGYYNQQSHNGLGMWGNTPDEAYAELLHEKRVVPKDKLHLMFMRYSKGTIKVGKNGITLKIYGEHLQYSDPNLWRDYFGKSVYVRYSPDNLTSVRVYNTDNQFICTAKLEKKLSYNATKEELQKATLEKKAQEKIIKDYKKVKNIQAQDALDAIINEGAEKLKTPPNFNAEILRIISTNEQQAEPLQKAAGGEDMPLLTIDMNAAVARLRAKK